MKQASLAEVPGTGFLSVSRGAEGDIIEAKGSWQPESKYFRVALLREQYEAGNWVVYDGPILDPDHPEEAQRDVTARTEVFIAGIHEQKGEGKNVMPLVTFVGRNIIGNRTLVKEAIERREERNDGTEKSLH